MGNSELEQRVQGVSFPRAVLFDLDGTLLDSAPDMLATANRLRDAQGADGIEVIGVALESQVEGVREFATANDMRYPVVLAAKQGIALMKALGNAPGGVPYTVYIGRDGKAVGSKLGLVRRADLEAAAQTLLK